MIENDRTETERIMIIDDIPENIRVLQHMLQGKGYRLSTFINGEMALQAAEREPPDLVLLDINMPEIDGFEVCSRLKENKVLENTTVIFISGLTGVEGKVKAFETGGVDYVTKPFSIDEIEARIESHLRLRRGRRQLEEQNLQLREAAKFKEQAEMMYRHDLKSPLTSIIGYSELIRMSDNLTEQQTRQIANIETAGLRIRDMVDRSLDILKIEQGRYELRPEPVDLVAVVLEVIEESRVSADNYRIKIILQIEGRAPKNGERFVVQGETMLVYSMISNLVKNAMEAAPPGTNVTVNLAKDEKTSIRVRNKGSVPAEIRDRFFEKFVTCGKEYGTGLGTYCAKLFAEVQGGSITLDTSEEATTTVIISI